MELLPSEGLPSKHVATRERDYIDQSTLPVRVLGMLPQEIVLPSVGMSVQQLPPSQATTPDSLEFLPDGGYRSQSSAMSSYARKRFAYFCTIAHCS